MLLELLFASTIGAGVGFVELLSRYKDASIKQLLNFKTVPYSYLFIFINALASALTLYYIHVFGLSVGALRIPASELAAQTVVDGEVVQTADSLTTDITSESAAAIDDRSGGNVHGSDHGSACSLDRRSDVVDDVDIVARDDLHHLVVGGTDDDHHRTARQRARRARCGAPLRRGRARPSVERRRSR